MAVIRVGLEQLSIAVDRVAKRLEIERVDIRIELGGLCGIELEVGDWSADLLDLVPRGGLLVGEDRECLQRRPRQPPRPQLLELLQVSGELGAGADLVAPRDLPDLERAILLLVLGVELVHEILGVLNLADIA